MVRSGDWSREKGATVIHRSPFADVEIPAIPFTELVLGDAHARGDRPALIDGPTGRVLTYRGLDSAARRLAGGLIARGFGPGDVLALLAPNMPEYAAVFHGVSMTGGAVTTINPAYTDREIHHQLVDSGATLAVTVADQRDLVDAAAVGTAVRSVHILDVSSGEMHISGLTGAAMAGTIPIDLDSVMVLPYSSGTTGLSKGVMLTHRSLTANVCQVNGSAALSDDDVIMAVLPFFHIYGMQVLMNCGLAIGATIITMPKFDLELFLRLHQDHRITRCFIAPPIAVALAKHPSVDNYDLSSLRQIFSGAAPLSATLAAEVVARIGCEVVQGYGMTELSPVSHLTPPGRGKPGSAGLTAPNTETRIVDTITGEPLGFDADGEVWVRGPQVMKGYLNNPAATATTIDAEGWLHTGDIGHIDADGHLYIVDRLKELIKVKGFQVPPAELEALLLTHPSVADSAVIGVDDNEAGEVPVGFVVLKAGQTASGEELMAFVAATVAHYKRLHEVRIVDVIPKSASGKILRRVLRDGWKG
jgi:acyl-CoA synthetase (AMP-forming)/AMP-acid ligase II